MMKRNAFKWLIHLMCAAGIMGLSTHATAAAFQLYEQDGASIGDYHAGRAAQANNASTAFYNPAGLTNIHNQQFVVGDVFILSDLKYRGTVGVNTISGGAPVGVVSQGGAFSQVPDLFYTAPINDRFSVGLSVVAPFGLKTVYGRNNNLRFAATETQLDVIDVSPSLAFKIIPQVSVGAGFDWSRMSAEFNQDATLGDLGGGLTANSYNKAWSTADGFHLGALFQVLPSTRVGISYNSQIVHHVRGTSKLIGPAANLATTVAFGTPSAIVSRTANAHITLPAYTTLSAFNQLNSKWSIMGTAIYTQWSVFKTLALYQLAAINVIPVPVFPGVAPVPTTSASVTLTENYRNAWNFSLGTEYAATDKMILRGGVGYDQSPLKNNLRDVRIPDSSRYALALGGHYQAIKSLGFDLGWTHLFVPGTAKINPPPVAVGAQVVTTNGNMQTSADIFGAQVTWDIV
jgi:long-chain fatty acid transport protein